MPDVATGGERFAFRWARGLAIALGVAAALMLVGVAGMVWGVMAASESWWILPVGAIPLLLAVGFVGVFAWRMTDAFAAVQSDGVRIEFPLSLSGTIPFANISSAAVVGHNFLYGIGIRTNLAGHVALASAWGPSAEFELREPVRTGILPFIWSTHARTLRLTVERPDEFVAAVSARIAATGERS